MRIRRQIRTIMFSTHKIDCEQDIIDNSVENAYEELFPMVKNADVIMVQY